MSQAVFPVTIISVILAREHSEAMSYAPFQLTLVGNFWPRDLAWTFHEPRLPVSLHLDLVPVIVVLAEAVPKVVQVRSYISVAVGIVVAMKATFRVLLPLV